MSFNPKWIVGKTVKSVERDPSFITVHFTDGSHVVFGGHDDDVGDEVTIAEANYYPAPKSASSRAASAPSEHGRDGE